MKTATCTHCSQEIYWDAKTLDWRHTVPTQGGNGLTCAKIEIATPRRGSIKKEKAEKASDAV